MDLVCKTEEILEKKSGFLIRDHNIEYFGLCKKCRPGGARILSEKEFSRSGLERCRAGYEAARIPRKEIP
jgi:hypothetical protein